MVRLRLLVLTLVSVLTVACASATSTTSTSAGGAPESAAGLVPTVAGGQLDLGSVEGQDTVLWFWAPW